MLNDISNQGWDRRSPASAVEFLIAGKMQRGSSCTKTSGSMFDDPSLKRRQPPRVHDLQTLVYPFRLHNTAANVNADVLTSYKYARATADISWQYDRSAATSTDRLSTIADWLPDNNSGSCGVQPSTSALRVLRDPVSLALKRS